jgi:predicted RNase H-like nuclease (RuvC/YqgF family)
MKYSRKRPKGSGDESTENLRGKFRELEKQVEIQKRYIKSLEKRLKRLNASEENFTSTKRSKKIIEEELESNDKENSCSHCGNTLIEKPIWTPTGEVMWVFCQGCKFKEKKKSGK